MRTRVLHAAAVVPVAGVLLTGCASFLAEQPGTGPDLLADVVANMENAGSVRVEGPMANSSDFYDVHVQGDDAVGTLSMGADYDAPFVALDGEAWFLPPDNFFTDFGATEEEAAPLRGRYISLRDGDFRTNWPDSLDDVIELLPTPDEVAPEVEVGSLDGEDVWILTTEDGAQLTVEAGSLHHPLTLLVPAETDEGSWGDPEHTIRFSDVGERRSIVAPEDPLPADVMGS